LKQVRFTSERERLFDKALSLKKVKAAQWKELALDILYPLFITSVESDTIRIFQLLHSITFAIYRLKPLPRSMLQKIHSWTVELVGLIELHLGASYIKPKTHMLLHIHAYISQIGPLSMCDTFQLENLLSLVRRNIHSKISPEIQGFQTLITNVTVPVIDQYLKEHYSDLYTTNETSFSSALDVVMNIERRPIKWIIAYGGHFYWNLCNACEYGTAEAEAALSKYFKSGAFTVQLFSKAFRKDMIVTEDANDFDQSCVMLSSLSCSRSKRQTRIDYNVMIKYSEKYFVGSINYFLLATHNGEESVFAALNLYETTAHAYSQDLNQYSKCYYTTPGNSSYSVILPLACIRHKCDVYSSKTGLTWFH